MQVSRSQLHWSPFLTGQQVGWSTIVLCALLVFTGGGCEVVGVFQKDPDRRVDHDIQFQVAEEHEIGPVAPDVPEIVFTMRTKKNFGCLGYRIRHEIERTKTKIVLRFLGIESPGEVCLAALGPASARFQLPLDVGSHTLVLLNGEIRDEYTIDVTNKRIEVTSVESEGTEPIATLHWRYPRDSFAYYCGTTLDTKSLCTDFQDQLEDLSLSRIEVPEEGVWPYSLRSKGHHFDAPAQFYRYSNKATWEEVKARLRTFTRERIRDREGIGLEVENWLFGGVMSWMVDRQ